MSNQVYHCTRPVPQGKELEPIVPTPNPYEELEDEENVEDTIPYEDIPVLSYFCLKCGKGVTIEDGFCPHCKS